MQCLYEVLIEYYNHIAVYTLQSIMWLKAEGSRQLYIRMLDFPLHEFDLNLCDTVLPSVNCMA